MLLRLLPFIGLLTINWSVATTKICAQHSDLAFQRFPQGVEESKYFYRSAKPKKVVKPRIEPPFWWTGMAVPEVEVLLYDTNMGGADVHTSYPGVNITKITRPQNSNYLFVNLKIAPGTKPGTVPLKLTWPDGKTRQINYVLKKRQHDKERIQGITSDDMIYLIMPDRFVNADNENDEVAEMRQLTTDRTKFLFRHGGDLQGIIHKLDYLKRLGITAIWLNPVLENDQPYESYHGYAVTDHYRIDPRLGTNEDYLSLVEAAHRHGLKVIMDIVHNHVGDQHWFIRDLPSEDWIHQAEKHQGTLYRATVHMDPHVAQGDLSRVTDGWFDTHMPDLNHDNPQLRNYLTQNHLWWTEYSGHDGYRIDTYAYCDQAYMADWGARMQLEYPNLGLFAETWVHGVPVQAQFTQNNNLRDAYNAHMPGVTDFQWHYGVLEALNQSYGWTSGVSRLYYVLSKDFLYEDPTRNVLFLDNHDMSRIADRLSGDLTRIKSGLALLMTSRGIPMVYYGTEIGMSGSGGAFGEGGRRDFPGGWPDDNLDKFTAQGRSDKENALFNYFTKLANFRKNSPALRQGKLIHYVPENDGYVYFRKSPQQTILVAYNSGDQELVLDTYRFADHMGGFSRARDVVSNELISIKDDLKIPPHSTLVWELMD